MVGSQTNLCINIDGKAGHKRELYCSRGAINIKCFTKSIISITVSFSIQSFTSILLYVYFEHVFHVQ